MAVLRGIAAEEDGAMPITQDELDRDSWPVSMRCVAVVDDGLPIGKAANAADRDLGRHAPLSSGAMVSRGAGLVR